MLLLVAPSAALPFNTTLSPAPRASVLPWYLAWKDLSWAASLVSSPAWYLGSSSSFLAWYLETFPVWTLAVLVWFLWAFATASEPARYRTW